jgi:hypothetical protein
MARNPRRHDPAPKDRRAGTLLHCFCPHCRASLHEGESLNLLVLRADGTRGRLSLSPFLNDFASFSSIALPDGEEVSGLFCPACGHSLREEQQCAECGAHIARIQVRVEPDAFDFYICLRKSCFWHGVSDDARVRMMQDITGASSAGA